MNAMLSDGHQPMSDRQAFLENQLSTLYRVSEVLSRSLDLRETMHGVLEVLHEQGSLSRGMVSLVDQESGELTVIALHDNRPLAAEPTRYRAGEGIVGAILARGEPIVVRRIADEPRFLDRLGVYNPERPFIGVPIKIGERETVGVFAAQPSGRAEPFDEQVRFLQMVANLMGQTVRLARQVEDEQQQLRDERDVLRRRVKGEHGFANIVGHTDAMRVVFEQVRQVAKWNTTVLIRGESGTGKELIANAIHYNSPRANGPFVKLNCAALPDNLLESELFGHEKGAFTGAVTRRTGRFEQADGGTLFLDEIGEISPAFQAKLLRVLQEGEFERVGGLRTLKVDVRVIAATNRDLESEVQRGDFREDLYYRLNVMPIATPALRERVADIPDLTRYLTDKVARAQGRDLEVTNSAIRLLMRHNWPGNVRELENCLERAAIMSPNGIIDRDTITLTGIEESPAAAETAAAQVKVDFNDPELDERERVIAALEEAGWVQARAARLLGMTPRQIAYRIQTYQIKVRQM